MMLTPNNMYVESTAARYKDSITVIMTIMITNSMKKYMISVYKKSKYTKRNMNRVIYSQ